MAKSWIDDAWLRDAVDRDGNRIPPTAAMRRAAGADPEKAKKTIPPEHRTARYGKGSRWVVYWNAPDGRRRKAFRSRADAEAFRAGMEDDLRSGRYIDPRGGERTVADAYREWIGTLVNIKVTANAIIHRNTGLAGPVLVKAFTTRVEVVSLGGLNGLSSDDLLNGVSLPVNPPLFARFVAQGFAHGTGGGLAWVMECYEGTGVAATVSATTNSVRLILPRIAPASGDGRIIRFPEACRAHPTLSMSEGRAF